MARSASSREGERLGPLKESAGSQPGSEPLSLTPLPRAARNDLGLRAPGPCEPPAGRRADWEETAPWQPQ